MERLGHFYIQFDFSFFHLVIEYSGSVQIIKSLQNIVYTIKPHEAL